MSASTDASHPWKSLVRARASAPCLNWPLHWAWLSMGFRCPAAIISILRGTGPERVAPWRWPMRRIPALRIAVSRSPNAERVVTPLELFFDLVYVFAIGQLSHHLLEHIDLRTGAETVILALAVFFYAWYMTAWGANWLEPDRLPMQLLLVGLMFVSLLMSVAIAEAFGGRAWLFVAAYLLLQVGRAAFLIVALRGRALGEHFVNVVVWKLIAGGLWVAGAIAEGTARLALWGFAVAVNYGGAGILHWLPGRGQRVGLGQTDIAGEHLIERFRLFFLIVLGESVLTAGNAFTDEPFEVERLLALAIGFTNRRALVVLLPAHRGDRDRGG